jgi:hypothetical protein
MLRLDANYSALLVSPPPPRPLYTQYKLSLQTLCRGRFVHRDRYLEQHLTEKIDTKVKDIEDMIG